MLRRDTFWKIVFWCSIYAFSSGNAAASGAAQIEKIHIGVGSHFAQRKGDVVSDSKHIADLGFSSLRDELYWQSVEPVKSSFRIPTSLSAYDNVLSGLSSNGIKPLLILSYGNPLYTPQGMPIDSQSRAGFAEYAKFVSERYQGKILGYEIWNEWNKAAGNKDRALTGDVESYWKLVETVSPVIRKSDKAAKVIVGAVAGRDIAWIKSLIKQRDFSVHADGVSVHPYNYCDGRSSKPEDVIAWIKSLDSLILSEIGSHVPIYMTEVGWPTQKGKCGTSEALSADYMARVILLAGGVPSLKGLYLYDFRDDGLDVYDREHNFGLINYFGKEKPSAKIASEAIAILRAAVYESQTETNDWVVMNYRNDAGGIVSVVWLKSGNPKNAELLAPCSKSSNSGRFSTRELGYVQANIVVAPQSAGLCSIAINLSTRPTVISGDITSRPTTLVLH